jgi:hypothetical protein
LGEDEADHDLEVKDRADFEALSKDLKGNTLRIYWFMLRNRKPRSAREIQRHCQISSSSLALHHLNKLIDLGLVGKDHEGQYLVLKRVRVGLLTLFVGSGRHFAPRFTFYAMFFTTLFLGALAVFWEHLTSASFLLLLSLFLASAVFWTETAKVWRMQPL